jgi:hypothetical protein
MATRKADRPVELWQTLDWSSHGPHGAAALLKTPQPCVICKQPAWLLSPEKQVPTHKTCAQEFLIVQQLGPILAALGHVVSYEPHHLAHQAPPGVYDPNCSACNPMPWERPAVVPADDSTPEHISNPRNCRQCGNRLLLISPGRDLCARCQPITVGWSAIDHVDHA